MLTTVEELEKCIGGKNALCDALIELFAAYEDDRFAWGKEIWDVAVVGHLIHPDWTPTKLVPSPLLTDDSHWRATSAVPRSARRISAIATRFSATCSPSSARRAPARRGECL